VKDNNMNKQMMNLEIFKKGFAYIETLDKKNQSDPLLDSPLASIGHPDGWKTVVTLLIWEKGYTFDDAAKKLKEAWLDPLSVMNADRDNKNAKTEICTEQALRRRVLQVAMQRYRQAKAKLKGKWTPEEKAEQTRILEEVKNLYEFLELELPTDPNTAAPTDDEMDGKGDVEAATDTGNADKATIPAEKAPTTDQGEPPAPVGKEPKGSTADVATENGKKDTNGTPPPKPSIETPPNPELVGQGGDGGKDGNGGNEFTCPKCGGKMVARKAKSGKNIGNEFLGCAAYPDCKSMRTLDGQILSA
jgi:restriction system protein